jgi:uncharacterized protein YkwD
MSQYEVDILAASNTDHIKYCGSPMVSSDSLNLYARNWSATQAARGAMGHSNLTFSGTFRGENVAWGSGSYNTPEKIMSVWRNSIDHYKNIINCSYTRTGIGYVNGYWTQVFSS